MAQSIKQIPLSSKIQEAEQSLIKYTALVPEYGLVDEADKQWMGMFRNLSKLVLDDLRYEPSGRRGDGRPGNGADMRAVNPDWEKKRRIIQIRMVDLAYFYTVSLRRGEFKRWTMNRAQIDKDTFGFGLQRICIPLRTVEHNLHGVYFRDKDSKKEPDWFFYTTEVARGTNGRAIDIKPSGKTYDGIRWHSNMILTDEVKSCSIRVFQRITDLAKNWEVGDFPKSKKKSAD